MTTIKQTYQDRAERLAKAVDIADKVIRDSAIIPVDVKKIMSDWGLEVKHSALNPEPQFKKVVSIKYLENDFLIYWNESIGEDVDKFWAELYKNKIDFERKDTIQAVLKRRKIKNIHEYDNVIDNIVVAEQTGRINKEQVIELNRFIEEFENRGSSK